jgi:hypothetical protein
MYPNSFATDTRWGYQSLHEFIYIDAQQLLLSNHVISYVFPRFCKPENFQMLVICCCDVYSLNSRISTNVLITAPYD